MGDCCAVLRSRLWSSQIDFARGVCSQTGAQDGGVTTWLSASAQRVGVGSQGEGTKDAVVKGFATPLL